MAIHKNFYKSLFFLFILIVLTFYLSSTENKKEENQILEVQFSELPGWLTTDILPSLKAFEQSCKYISIKNSLEEKNFFKLSFNKDSYINFCKLLSNVKTNDELKFLIEESFYPAYLSSKETLFTGYVELEIKGRLNFSLQEAPNAVPIFKKPPNIISIDLEKFGQEHKEKKITGMLLENDFVPVPSRKIIENQNMFNEHILAYIDDPALAYFLHIQGSGIITLPTGKKMAVGYAGDNGKKYYSIGKDLIEEGIIKKENISMQTILNWMRSNEKEAFDLMQKNSRFIFFQERNKMESPKGSSGTEVTPMYSAAIDNKYIPYHLPLWTQVDNFYVNSEDKEFTNIFIAQDTGSAIKGFTRMDLFLGKGKNSEIIAGKLNSSGKIWALIPRDN
jgi:membrane-bound lytic murein transglycosylase A